MGERTSRRAAGSAAASGAGRFKGRIYRSRDGLPRVADPRQRIQGFPDGHGNGQGVPGSARPIRHGLLRFNRQEPRRAGRRCLLRQLPHRNLAAGVPAVPSGTWQPARRPLLYADLLLLGRRHQSGRGRLAPVTPQQPNQLITLKCPLPFPKTKSWTNIKALWGYLFQNVNPAI